LGAVQPARGFAPLLLHPVTASGPVAASAVGIAATVALFALNGYGGAVYFSEEMHAPEKGIARVILLSLIVTLAVEIVPLVAVLVGAPDLRTLFSAPDPLDLFVAVRGGSLLSNCVALGVAIAIINAAIANILAISR